jgi:hypothetical protein
MGARDSMQTNALSLFFICNGPPSATFCMKLRQAAFSSDDRGHPGKTCSRNRFMNFLREESWFFSIHILFQEMMIEAATIGMGCTQIGRA